VIVRAPFFFGGLVAFPSSLKIGFAPFSATASLRLAFPSYCPPVRGCDSLSGIKGRNHLDAFPSLFLHPRSAFPSSLSPGRPFPLFGSLTGGFSFLLSRLFSLPWRPCSGHTPPPRSRFWSACLFSIKPFSLFQLPPPLESKTSW